MQLITKNMRESFSVDTNTLSVKKCRGGFVAA